MDTANHKNAIKEAERRLRFARIEFEELVDSLNAVVEPGPHDTGEAPYDRSRPVDVEVEAEGRYVWHNAEMEETYNRRLQAVREAKTSLREAQELQRRLEEKRTEQARNDFDFMALCAELGEEE